MYSLIRIVAIVIILVILLFSIIAFVASDETSFTVSEQIGSPATVVWRTLINEAKTPEWNTHISRIKILNGKRYQKGSELIIYLRDNNQEVESKVKIISFNPEKKLVFQELPLRKKSLLRNHQQEYQLKSLLDGSTELSVAVNYSSASFITRIFDRIYIRAALMNKQRRELLALKKYIENL